MHQRIDMADSIDAFLRCQKRLLGVDVPSKWEQGWENKERFAAYPIEVDGELSDAKLEIACLNTQDNIQFRIGIYIPFCISRLDYTDEVHQNTLAGWDDNIPQLVRGPHYHSWSLNKRFFKGATQAPRLRNACRFPNGRDLKRSDFDSILRWFLAEHGIESLPSNHAIALPPKDWLL